MSIVGKGSGNDFTQQYNVQMDNNQKIDSVIGDAAQTGYFLLHVGSGVFKLNEWVMGGATLKGTLSSVYINGVLDSTATTTGTRTANTANIYLGAKEAGQNMTGSFALVLAYNRGLIADDIKWLHREPYDMFLR